MLNEDMIECKRTIHEIQRILIQNRAHNYLGRQVKGKLLDIRNGAGIMTHSTAIRKRKLLNDQSEYELCLLLDLSGSIYSTMAGQDPLCSEKKERDGLYNITAYAYMLLQAFIPVLGKNNVHIWGFNRDFVNLKYLFLKKKMGSDNIKENVAYLYDEVKMWSYYKDRNGGNHDGYALSRAVAETPWKDDVDVSNRIVIHFSDGQPACGGCKMDGCNEKDSGLIKQLKNSVKRLEKSGYLLVGVGIGYDGVKDFYKTHNTVAQNPVEMYKGTLNILKTQIKRGNFS